MAASAVALTVVNGVRLEPVQLKQPPVDGDVADVVERLHRLDGGQALLLLRQTVRLRPGQHRRTA